MESFIIWTSRLGYHTSLWWIDWIWDLNCWIDISPSLGSIIPQCFQSENVLPGGGPWSVHTAHVLLILTLKISLSWHINCDISKTAYEQVELQRKTLPSYQKSYCFWRYFPSNSSQVSHTPLRWLSYDIIVRNHSCKIYKSNHTRLIWIEISRGRRSREIAMQIRSNRI